MNNSRRHRLATRLYNVDTGEVEGRPYFSDLPREQQERYLRLADGAVDFMKRNWERKRAKRLAAELERMGS